MFYQNEFDIENYKEILINESFLDNLILNISSQLTYIIENKEEDKINKLKKKISEKIIKNNLWFYSFNDIIKSIYFKG